MPDSCGPPVNSNVSRHRPSVLAPASPSRPWARCPEFYDGRIGRVLIDRGTPAPLRRALVGHTLHAQELQRFLFDVVVVQ